MTLEDQIIVDLLISQSTADSIAGRIEINGQKAETEHITVILRCMEKEGLVRSGTIAGSLTVWILTADGIIHAKTIKPTFIAPIYPNPPAIPA